MESLREIYKRADFAFDLGQGDSFSDIYGYERFNWINSQYILAEKYNIPVCILPQTIGPFVNDDVKNKAIKTINNAKEVLVRDRQSFDYVNKIVPNKNITEAVDIAFFMPHIKKNFNIDNIHVGLKVSALLWNGGYTNNNQFGLTVDCKKLIY